MLEISVPLLAWYDAYGRKDLPWQHDPTPYRVWVSEIMLQQTQVTTVISFYQRFMAEFPVVEALANATLDSVLHHWSGLGYYARARNLHKTAGIVANELAGEFPEALDGLIALPGIGRSTAGAILALASDQRQSILDGNVKRVLTRLHAIPGWPEQSATKSRLWELADQHTPTTRVAAYTQAIMDLGATLCTRTRPRCEDCPLVVHCAAYRSGTPDAFPGKKPKRTLPVKATTMVLMCDEGGRVLLERRPPTGIWGGLWSFPECEEPAMLADWCGERYGFVPRALETWPVVQHGFTHFRLHITPIHAIGSLAPSKLMEPGNLLWYNDDSTRLGLAAPISELLSALKIQQTGI